jgi:hypothetical protein
MTDETAHPAPALDPDPEGQDEPTAAGVPVPGAGREDEDAHGGSLVGPDAGSTDGTDRH